MENTINIGDREITLQQSDIETHIDIDSLTTIDSSNIFGEAVTVSAAVNRIGFMRSELESKLSEVKLEEKVYSADFCSKLRKQASENSGKFKAIIDKTEVEIKLTEKALDSELERDLGWQKKRKKYIEIEKQFNMLSSLEWSIKDKAKKLNGFMTNVTPCEFVDSLVEGKVNGMMVLKPKKKGSIGG